MLTCIDDFGDLQVRAVRDAGNRIVLYESREVFSGMGAVVLKETMEEGLKGQGLVLKMLKGTSRICR